MENQTQIPPKSAIKAAHRAIAAYRERLANYDERAVAHETGRRFAFQALLEDTARLHHWDVTREQQRDCIRAPDSLSHWSVR
ncbi:MAG: hypothetical protein ACYDBJ_11065 [Aggregatilineales bacterium]